MPCVFSLIYIFIVAGEYTSSSLSLGQALIYSIYGLIMFWHTSKPYWSKNR